MAPSFARVHAAALTALHLPPPAPLVGWDPHSVYNDSKNYDFGYDPVMFGPHTFIHAPNSSVRNATTTGAVDLLAHFHDDLHMRFAGIRKPRTYSNQALSNASGWLLPSSCEVGAGGNNW